MRRSILALLLAVGATLISAPSYAHPRLRAATPAPGSVAAVSPREIRLVFSEPLLPRFSTVQLIDQTGRLVPTRARVAANTRQVIVALPVRLAAGVYRVSWRVVSAD